MSYVIAIGDCFNGLDFYADPSTNKLFETHDDAVVVAEEEFSHETWNIVEVKWT